MRHGVHWGWTLLVVGLLVALSGHSAPVATTLAAGQGHAIHFSRIAVWGDSSGLCIAGGPNLTTVTPDESSICVDAVFTKWQGYHKGSFTLVPPTGSSIVSSFHGTHRRHVLHGFNLGAGRPAGLWIVSLRVDGQQATKTMVAVQSPLATPVPTAVPEPTRTPVPAATSTPIPVVTATPTGPDGQAFMLPASVFAPATPSAQPWGVVDAAGANASAFAAPHSHRLGYDVLGFKAGASQQAVWTSSSSDPVTFRYLGGIYTDAAAAARAFTDGVDTLQANWPVVPTNCQTVATGAQCASGVYRTSGTTGETYVIAQENQCTLEVMASYDFTAAAQSFQIMTTVNAITVAAQTVAASICGWNPAPVATVAVVIPTPRPTDTPYVAPTPYPTWVPYYTPTPYPVYYPPPGGGLCNDHDNDDNGLPPGSNDYDTNGCN